MEKKAQFDTKELQKDFDKLVKKHNLKVAIFATDCRDENNIHKIVLYSEHEDKKLELPLGQAVINLFTKTGFDINSFNNLYTLIEELEEYNRVKQITVKKDTFKQKCIDAEKLLSETDLALLNQIRILKHDYIVKQQYEKASEYRDQEIKLLQVTK